MEIELQLANFKMLGETLKEKANNASLYEVDELHLTEFMYDLGGVMGTVQLAEIGKISRNFAGTAVDVFNDKWAATAKELLEP